METVMKLNANEIAEAIRDYANKKGYYTKGSIDFQVNPLSATVSVERKRSAPEDDDCEWAWSQGR